MKDERDRELDQSLVRGTDPAGRKPEEIERDIAETRAELSGTLQELEQKLTPGEVAREAAGAVREKARGAADAAREKGSEMASNVATGVSRNVKQNPLPYAVIAAGVAWLIASTRKQSAYDYERYGWEGDYSDRGWSKGSSYEESGSTLRRKAYETRERAGERAHEMRERAGELTHRTADTARDAAHRVQDTFQHGTERAREGFETMLHEQPLVLTGIGFALGAILGAVLPSTRKEEELFGESRDRLVHQVEEKGREQLDRAEKVVEKAAEGARERAEQEMQRQKEPGRQQQSPNVTPGSQAPGKEMSERQQQPGVPPGTPNPRPDRRP